MNTIGCIFISYYTYKFDFLYVAMKNQRKWGLIWEVRNMRQPGQPGCTEKPCLKKTKQKRNMRQVGEGNCDM